MRTKGSVEIDRLIDDVFRLTNDHVAEWSELVKEEHVINRTDDGVGTTFRTITEENGRKMEFDGVVTRYEPPHASAIRMTGGVFDIEAGYMFEDVQGRTRVTQIADVHGKGVFKVVLMLMGVFMKSASCKALDKELQGLKRFCERESHSDS